MFCHLRKDPVPHYFFFARSRSHINMMRLRKEACCRDKWEGCKNVVVSYITPICCYCVPVLRDLFEQFNLELSFFIPPYKS
jgi:hypothetical protein